MRLVTNEIIFQPWGLRHRQTSKSGRASHERAADVERACGHRAVGTRVDGTVKNEVAGFVDHALKQHGAPYALINNAGIKRDGVLVGTSDEAWSSVIDANLNAMFHMTKIVLPAMIEAGNGSVVQMSSVTAIRGNAGQANYAATKAAMLGFTRTLAHEVARFNVRVNAVLPGLIETDMTRDILDTARRSLRAMIPMRRMGRISDVADCMKFLISDRASYITGQDTIVDGGLTA